jgi:hypothetical protein
VVVASPPMPVDAIVADEAPDLADVQLANLE